MCVLNYNRTVRACLLFCILFCRRTVKSDLFVCFDLFFQEKIMEAFIRFKTERNGRERKMTAKFLESAKARFKLIEQVLAGALVVILVYKGSLDQVALEWLWLHGIPGGHLEE